MTFRRKYMRRKKKDRERQFRCQCVITRAEIRLG